MAEFVLKSGAKLAVSPSEWGKANELRKAVFRSMAAHGLAGFKGAALIQLLAENEIENLIFSCGEAASYNGHKVNIQLFNDPKYGAMARGDYHEIFAKILEVNLDPFFVHASFESNIQEQVPLPQA